MALASVGDCLADSGGGLRFGAPGAARRNHGPRQLPPCRLTCANYINHRRENSNGACRRGGHKSKERGPTSCQTIPSRPHHIRFLTTSANIISISLHPQNFTPSNPTTASSRCLLSCRHCIVLHSNLTAQALYTFGTYRAGDSVFSHRCTAAGTLCPRTETQPTVSAPDRDPP